VDAALALRPELEVLDGVRDVRRRPVDAGRLERLVEQPAGRPDERPARPVLLVAGLLADEHDPASAGPAPGHRLRRRLPQRAAAAAVHRRGERREVGPRTDRGGTNGAAVGQSGRGMRPPYPLDARPLPARRVGFARPWDRSASLAARSCTWRRSPAAPPGPEERTSC
jgi:hypothetical protein